MKGKSFRQRTCKHETEKILKKKKKIIKVYNLVIAGINTINTRKTTQQNCKGAVNFKLNRVCQKPMVRMINIYSPV